MRFSTALTVLLLGVTMLLSACMNPPPQKYSRPENALKLHPGGYNPGSHGGKGGHHH